MKTARKKFFNLIEITMAVAVVGIGIGGIMALFPPAIQANKSADYYNYTGNMVNTLAAYIETELQRNWDTFSGKLKTKPGDSDADFNFKYSGTNWPSSSISGFPGLYAINNYVYGVLSEDQSIRAVIRVWRTTSLEALYYYPGNAPADSQETVGSDYRIRVYIEVGWPAAAARADQTTQLFVYEFVRWNS